MKKLFFIFLISTISLFGYQYDDTIIDIEVKLFPKIALMEQHLQRDQKEGLEIGIVYKEIDRQVAQSFVKKINKTYGKKILHKKIHAELLMMQEYKKVQKLPDVIIVLSYNPKEMRSVARWANKNRIVSFVYEPQDLHYGFVGSVSIGRTVRPYLNKETLKQFNFSFTPYLLQLSKF